MTTNKRRKKYAGLGSMDELMKERRKLRRQIKYMEAELIEDGEDLKEMFSFSNLTDMFLDRFVYSSPMLRNIIAGARTVTSMLGLRKSGKRHRENDGCDW